jgi:predicted nucleotidyltransferase
MTAQTKIGGCMQAGVSRLRDHQVVFCGLEVLRLMAERMENQDEVDGQDLQLVLGFMRDIAHRCLDNTEELLRLASFEQHVAKHQQARALLDGLSDVKGPAFASACRQYTDVLANSIFEDRRCLSTLDCDPAMLSQFYEWEREIADLARQHSRTLRRLEMKYTSPHCI